MSGYPPGQAGAFYPPGGMPGGAPPGNAGPPDHVVTVDPIQCQSVHSKAFHRCLDAGPRPPGAAPMPNGVGAPAPAYGAPGRAPSDGGAQVSTHCRGSHRFPLHSRA